MIKQQSIKVMELLKFILNQMKSLIHFILVLKQGLVRYNECQMITKHISLSKNK